MVRTDDEGGVVGDLTVEALRTRLVRCPTTVRKLGVTQAGQATRLKPGTAKVARRLVAARHQLAREVEVGQRVIKVRRPPEPSAQPTQDARSDGTRRLLWHR